MTERQGLDVIEPFSLGFTLCRCGPYVLSHTNSVCVYVIIDVQVYLFIPTCLPTITQNSNQYLYTIQDQTVGFSYCDGSFYVTTIIFIVKCQLKLIFEVGFSSENFSFVQLLKLPIIITDSKSLVKRKTECK